MTLTLATLTLRLAQLADAEDIARLHARAGQSPHEDDEADFVFQSRLELWHHLLGGGPRRIKIWVALDPMGQILGFIGAGRARLLKDRFQGELTLLYVDHAAQRQGVGHQLVRHAMTALQAAGIASVMAWVPVALAGHPLLAYLRAEALSDRRRGQSAGIGRDDPAEIAFGFN